MERARLPGDEEIEWRGEGKTGPRATAMRTLSEVRARIVWILKLFSYVGKGESTIASHAGDWLDTASHSDTARAKRLWDIWQRSAKVKFLTNYKLA